MYESPLTFTTTQECQDLDECRSRMVQQLVGTGRLLAVGDVHQSLYGYMGANAEVLGKLKDVLGIEHEFALSCSWRLPVLHVKRAVDFMRRWHSDFKLESRPHAPEGLIAENATFREYPLDPTANHAILCRTNAPLMRLQLELVKRGIPCHMSGREELAAQMVKLVHSWVVINVRG